jgi:CRP-like cAMP-binding protein
MKRIELNDTLRSLLYEIPLFKDLSDSEVKLLIDDLDYVVYAYEKGEEVIHQGDLCRSLCILLKGILQVDIIDANGDSVLIEHITAPRSFATSHLFQEDNRFPATFTVKANSILLTATKESAFNLISKHPNLLKNFFCVSGRCNVCTTARLDILSRKTVRDRLIVYLTHLHRMEDNLVRIRLSQGQLAAYLNVSRQALSTEINKMEKEELIKRRDENLVELNLNLMKTL